MSNKYRPRRWRERRTAKSLVFAGWGRVHEPYNPRLDMMTTRQCGLRFRSCPTAAQYLAVRHEMARELKARNLAIRLWHRSIPKGSVWMLPGRFSIDALLPGTPVVTQP